MNHRIARRLCALSLWAAAWGLCPGLSAAADADTHGGRWQWLKGTYWYVPEANLQAMRVDTSAHAVVPINDQTVFQITGANGGYFWGRAVAVMNQGSANCTMLMGSVTPEGRVLLSFTPWDPSRTSNVIQGFGQMTQKAGAWTMENQMSSGVPRLQVHHWAYMVQVSAGDPAWTGLPGSGESVENFLAQCPALSDR